MSEPLYDCPHCGRRNFTQRGLTVHVRQHAEILTLDDEKQSREMGEQLTTQYKRAIGSLREVLVFGAMMVKLREVVSTCGHNSTHGPQTKGDGIKAWMEQYAPEISRPTAYRFMELADGLRNEFKLGMRVDLQRLLTCEAGKLEVPLAKKQQQIFEFLEGKSQRQLLFNFGRAERKHRGGWHPRQGEPPPILADTKAMESYDLWCTTLSFLEREGLEDKSWAHLEREHLERLHGILIDLGREVSMAVRKGKI